MSRVHSISYDPAADVCYRTLDFIGRPGYRVGDDGSVWSRMNNRWGPSGRWKKLKLWYQARYPAVYLGTEGSRRVREYVHFLVLSAFAGPRPITLMGLHSNDVRTDNRLANLSWGSRRRNVADSKRNGGWPIGQSRTQAKLSDSKVRRIRLLLEDQVPRTTIARMFRVNPNAIRQIELGITWSHVS